MQRLPIYLNRLGLVTTSINLVGVALVVALLSISPPSIAKEQAQLASVWAEITPPERRGLKRVLEQQQLRLITPIQPGWYQIDRHQASGAVVGLAKQLEQFLARRFSDEGQGWRVDIIPVAAAQTHASLLRGYGDLALSLTPEQPSAEIHYSIPLSNGFVPVWVSGPSQPAPIIWTHLAAKSVMVREGSATQQILQQKNADLQIRGYATATIIPVATDTPVDQLIALVREGRAPALAIDGGALYGQSLIGVNAEAELDLAPVRRLRLAVRAKNPQLLTLLNQFVTEFTGIETPPLPPQKSIPLAVAAPSPPSSVTELLQTAANKYRFDWRMLQGFAYRQSWFNQQARSASGGIGVMQITTSMASEVGITDVTELGANIEAGTKYLAKLRTTLFGDSTEPNIEATLITMAAYEAGVSRIARLQQQTKLRGFDPTRWHGHLEHLVRAEVGQAAVDGIDGIYRYYLRLAIATESTVTP